MAGGSYTPGSKLMLFASHIKGSTLSASIAANDVSNRGSYYLYYFQLCSSTGELKHNLMPAKNMTSNVVGLYDTVTSNFYAKATNSGDFIAAEWGSSRAGKKWTGLGADNKMSNGDNWQGGVAPSAGDDLDFTIAVPFAAIDADINATFGKVYLGAADLPSFTGSLTATAVNDLTRMQAYDTATADFTFTLAAPTGQDFTWNGGAGANWWTTDLWTYNSAASSWYDNNNAIFNTANATATLNANVTAESVVFGEDATIVTNGTDAATLTVPTVSVAQNVSATIAAPTAGTLAKTGAGTLTLTESRTDATTVTAGTLKMDGTASLDWSQFTFGTDSAKPVTLEVGPDATIANIPNPWKVQSINGVDTVFCKQGGDWSLSGQLYLGGTSVATASFQHNGGTLTVGHYLSVGEGGTGLLDICGGTVKSTPSGTRMLIGNTKAATVVVTNSGSLVVSGSVAVGNNLGSSGTLVVADGGTVSVGGSLIFCNRSASTSGRVDLGRGGVITAVNAYCMYKGSATFNFDGGTFVKASGTGNVFPVNGAATAIDVSVSANGGTIDNNGLAITIPCTIAGAGGLTLSGVGTTTISANQSYTGTTTVANGTTLSVGGGVTLAGPLALEAGSTLNLVSYTPGVTPVVASALALLESGTVALTLNGGAFPVGVYAICSATGGVAASDGNKFVPSTGAESFAWSVSGNKLVLTVGEVSGNMWTGLAGDGRISSAANWLNGVPAADADIDFSSVVSAVTINADLERTFGTVTMGEGVITFTGSLSAASFVSESLPGNPTKNVAVGKNSTVKIVGDLVFATNQMVYVCNSVAEGGTFAVTGDIIATSEQTYYVAPCETTSNAGVISAKGLVNDNRLEDCFALVRNSSNGLAKWVIGENGLSGTKRFFIGSPEVNDNNSPVAMISAATNFTISTAIVQYRNLTLDTAGYEITLGTNTMIKSGGILGGGAKNGLTTVTGNGKVIINYNVDDLSDRADSRTNAVTVASPATLAFNSGANIGFGTVTVQNGGTLEVAESGTVTLNGGLNLADGANLAFNFTDRRVAPQIAVAQGMTVTVSGAVKVKVSGDVWPTAGEKELTACGGFDAEGVTVTLADGAPMWAKDKDIGVNKDGNIVLTVKPKPAMIIVR